MPRFKIPEITVERLSIYLRAIKKFHEDEILSSQGLAELVGTSDGQVRKDLAYFGEFGVPGQGYKVGKLIEEISHILGLDKDQRIALVGVGKLGSALLAYPGFKGKGFKIKAAFDNDPSKVGKTWQGVTIQSVQKIARVISQEKIDIGIITTPAPATQEVANKLVEGGVKGILNFAPTRIVVPAHVKLRNVDLAIQLEGLSYFLTQLGP
ncbi:redox-sensing transcriptional repressor Rex [Candidatus Aerophobetes bacterium]|uniref:Redox-sensing transcriptional repressor Rex n=1 Tax=Aerophobetes bacterium TaxID=2030807 RepID=A0A523W5Z5_UNCAE|nr:MAG: redox-sensing transcriptional repressor Rex [Candidatus Aerophobetes bacterium]